MLCYNLLVFFGLGNWDYKVLLDVAIFFLSKHGKGVGRGKGSDSLSYTLG